MMIMKVIDSKANKEGKFLNLIELSEDQYFVEWGYKNDLGNKEVTNILDIEKSTEIFEEKAKEMNL